MKRCLVDVDGVLADFTSAFLEIARTITGVAATPDQVTRFDICGSIGLSAEQAAKVKRAIGNEHGLARCLAVYPEAQDGMRRLQEAADVWIVTSPWNSNPTWTHDREWWLKEHFGIPHSRVIHTSAKQLVRGDFLVDDKTETLQKWQADNDGIAVQWITPHNRLDGWTGLATRSWDELCAAVSP